MVGSRANYFEVFWHQDYFQNNNKNGGKNSPSYKNKRHIFSYKTLKNSSKTCKKIKFPIRHSQPISHTST